MARELLHSVYATLFLPTYAAYIIHSFLPTVNEICMANKSYAKKDSDLSTYVHQMVGEVKISKDVGKKIISIYLEERRKALLT